MAVELIHDRGRGPEIIGTRITVYNLLPHFLDPTATEAFICKLYDLTAQQVAAARAYVLNNADVVLARHLEIEARIAAGNPPEVIERAQQTKDAFLKFKDWVGKREQFQAKENLIESANACANSTPLPSFREWFAQQGTGTEHGK